jgi:hypothetical protein
LENLDGEEFNDLLENILQTETDLKNAKSTSNGTNFVYVPKSTEKDEVEQMFMKSCLREGNFTCPLRKTETKSTILSHVSFLKKNQKKPKLDDPVFLLLTCEACGDKSKIFENVEDFKENSKIEILPTSGLCLNLNKTIQDYFQ